ncbi:dTDP-4-dehydrorhamnose 3,5-epimerase family protein [Pseudolysinimonas sp.]|jgi:dTDP-4-dehydrorhamnose 3,5-epimerase|uniref:dTDP-4-dehydrorhamnose 3,5-epimerase family protein n=1 Tax=Pseudolysinimonas sp. TaxID=2680009 RepID=UPI003784ABEE
MLVRELRVRDAWELTPTLHEDTRGLFLELFRDDVVERVRGRAFGVRQSNVSVSRAGVLRGIHYSVAPDGQAKYVTSVWGRILDYVVDLRVGSDTFGEWDVVELGTPERRAVYLAEGIGHAVVALEDGATLAYLLSGSYSPEFEHVIDALDPALAIELPPEFDPESRSGRDRAGMLLAEAAERRLLPIFASDGGAPR